VSPYEPIPDSTQVHVDRLLGSLVGEYRVLERQGEGRLGTIYRGVQPATGKKVTLQVLRSELMGDDEEARAANAIKAPGVATVLSFGQVADGRRYRVIEPLEGESLDQLVQRKGRLTPKETAQVLDLVAVVLQAAHAWAVVHGNLGASSVFLSGDVVKLIDFGLARRKVNPQDDLRALGALGFTLMTGQELRDGVPPPLSHSIPEPFDRLLRELLEQRHVDATSARRELAQVGLLLDAPAPLAVVPPRSQERSRELSWVALLAGVVALGAGVAFFVWPVAAPQQVVVAPVVEEDELELVDDVTEVVEVPAETPSETAGPRPFPKAVKSVRPVPSAEALYALTTKLEAKLRKQPLRYGDDVEQALFVLNKQRLRLSGSPSLEDRKDVARQLAGWRRSYLRK
jgi:serine/threonine protein kinase